MGRPANTVERMIRGHVEKTPTCWLWHGALSGSGYASVSINRVNRDAHRVFFEHFKGPVPDGNFVHSLCRNKRCVNPAHLEAVTIEESVHRGENPAGINFRKIECVRGHPLSGVNLYIDPSNGSRQCRRCRTLRQQTRRARKAQARGDSSCAA